MGGQNTSPEMRGSVGQRFVWGVFGVISWQFLMSARFRTSFLLAVLTGLSRGSSLAEGQAAEPPWRWRLADRPRLDLGGEGADSNTCFSRVQAAFRLRDGRVAIAAFNALPTIPLMRGVNCKKRAGGRGTGTGDRERCMAAGQSRSRVPGPRPDTANVDDVARQLKSGAWLVRRRRVCLLSSSRPRSC